MKKIYLIFLLALSSIAQAQVCPTISDSVVDVSCFGAQDGVIDVSISEPNILFDGSIIESAWGTALSTSAGGPAPGFGSGHEINAIHLNASLNNLYVGVAGNVQDQNRILLFIDCKPGGFNNGSFDRSGASFGLTSGAFNSGITFDAGFFADYCVTVGTNTTMSNYFVDIFPLLASGANNTYYGDNTHPLIQCAPANSSNTAGFEIAIPWDSLGGQPNQNIKVFAIYQSDNGFMSNQFLTPAGSGEGNYGNNPVDFSVAAPNPVSTAPMLTTWNTGDSSLLLIDLSGGTYTLTVSNGVGCSTTVSYTITEATAPLLLTETIVTPIICNGDSATVTAVASGGTAPYTGDIGSFTIGAGTSIFVCSDMNGCLDSTTITLSNPPVIKTSSLIDTLTCFGDTANITIGATGGIPPMSGLGTFTLTAGPYSFIVTDSLGCTDTISGNLVSPAQVVVTATAGASNICDGKNVQLTASGANTYVWQPSGTTASMWFAQPSLSTTYTLTGSNAQGCTDTDLVTVQVDPQPGDLVQTQLSNAVSIVGNECVRLYQADGNAIDYTNRFCELLASISDPSGGAVLDTTEVCVEVLSSVLTYNSQPYVPRITTIAPSNVGATSVTLYVTDQDFVNYNASRGAFDSIATNAGGNTTATVAVTVALGGIGVGTSYVYSPLTATWNAATNYWEINLPATSYGTFYIHTVNDGNSPLENISLSLNGEAVNDKFLLKWQTINQEKVNYYTINQTLGNNTAQVASLTNDGNAAQAYQLALPVQPTSYEILAHTNSGAIVKSNKVSTSSSGHTVLNASAQNGELVIWYSSTNSNALSLQLIDVQGRVVGQNTVLSTSTTQAITIRSSAFSSGIYTVLARDKWGKVIAATKCVW
ncbi:MAG: hypothetical protein RL660_101 [Bacteroidota bacterium]|jgi:hypothetical protein